MARIGSSGTGGASTGGGGGSGNVSGIAPTTIGAIAQWANTSGTSIQNSPNTFVQTGGGIESQGFAFNTQILNDITVPDNYAAIYTNVYLISGDIILDGNAELKIV